MLCQRDCWVRRCCCPDTTCSGGRWRACPFSSHGCSCSPAFFCPCFGVGGFGRDGALRAAPRRVGRCACVCRVVGAGRLVGALRSPLLVSRLLARDASWMGDVIRAANTTPPFSLSFTSNRNSTSCEKQKFFFTHKKLAPRSAGAHQQCFTLGGMRFEQPTPSPFSLSIEKKFNIFVKKK